MKNAIHKKSFLNACILLVFGLFLMLPLGCQSDFEEADTTQVKQQNFKTRTIPLSEIANGQNEIRSFIKATNEASSDSRTSIPGAIFDERNIMEVTDSIGIINYSTKFNYVNDPENIFYNLVLNVLPNGQKTSYIFKYTCNLQDFQRYKLSNYNYNYFVGTTEMKNYEDPTTQTGTNNRTSADCEPVLIPSPGSNGSSNNSGGSGGGTSASSLNTTVMGYNVNNHASNFSVSWGGNTTYSGGVSTTSGGGSSPHCGCISMGGGLFIFCFGEVRDPHHHKNGNTTGKSLTYNPDCIRKTIPLGLVPMNNIVSASYDLRTILNLTREQNRWLGGREYIAVDIKNYVLNHWTDEGKAFAVEMINTLIEDTNNNESGTNIEGEIATLITLELEHSGNLNNLNSNQSNFIIQQNLATIGPGLGSLNHLVMYNAMILQELSVIMSSYPNNHVFTNLELAKIYAEACVETLHLMADILGMAPGVGAIFDVTNGALYVASGDYMNGVISLTAAVPFAGDWTSVARITKRVYILSNSKRVILKAYKLANGVIIFSNRSQLRKVLGIVNNAIHAHHVIPYGLSSEPLVQLAARFSSQAKKAFHINDIANGIPIPKDFHLNGHSIYSAKIKARMQVLYGNANGNMELAYDYLTAYMTQVKNTIAANPNMTLGQIATLIP